MRKIWIASLAATTLGAGVIVSFASTGGETATARTAQPAVPAARAQLSMAGPVVAELFTSQGCSSCPPADAVAARLARDPAILVISRPVTYWDRLGWKDSLGREENTRLQRQYGDTAFSGANIYTPQLVVDGAAQSVGSQEAKVRNLIFRAGLKREMAGVSVQVSRTADGGRVVALDGQTGQNAELVLVALSSHEMVNIGRGENGGRTVSYTNVVVDEFAAGRWTGGKQSITLRAAQLKVPGADRYALILRRGAGSTIIGSALI